MILAQVHNYFYIVQIFCYFNKFEREWVPANAYIRAYRIFLFTCATCGRRTEANARKRY